MQIVRGGSVFTWAIVVALALAPAVGRAGREDASGESSGATPPFRVGHTVKTIIVKGALDPLTGTSGEKRPIQVQLWYPARAADDCADSDSGERGPDGCQAPMAVYSSPLNGLYGELLSPLHWSPLTWTIPGAMAREGAPLAETGGPLPVIIFSHGNQNSAIDYAYTLEALASQGYIVAAPDHLNNTQDEVRIDFANAALNAAHQPLIPCRDGAAYDPGANGLPVCSRPSVSKSMVDRYHDVQAILEALPEWFEHAVDMERVGMMGHSRGSVTSLAVAGGSTTWGSAEGVPFEPDSCIKAVMGLSIGTQNVTTPVDVQKITVPVLLVGGTQDKSGPLAVSEWAIASMTKLDPADKQLVIIDNAYHRHFDSAYCAEMQRSGTIALNDTSAALDRQTATQIMYHPTSGFATDYCALGFFDPPGLRTLAQSTVAKHVTGFTFPSVVPTSGLTTDEVKDEVVSLAVRFFGQALNRGDDGVRPATRCLRDEHTDGPSSDR